MIASVLASTMTVSLGRMEEPGAPAASAAGMNAPRQTATKVVESKFFTVGKL
jgi:hypothetical protein